MGDRKTRAAKFQLEVPLNASGVDIGKAGHKIKVGIYRRDKCLESKIVQFDNKGKAKAEFKFDKPVNGIIKIGPPEASDEDLANLDTLEREIIGREWFKSPSLKFPAIELNESFLSWVWHWCRWYTLRGRVLCPDGSPVPGARVCARDVDYWWQSQLVQELGCAITDIDGSFEIKFRWCCHWRYWPWYRRRFWRFDPCLFEKLELAHEHFSGVIVPPSSGAQPNAGFFNNLLQRDGEIEKSLPAEFDPQTFSKVQPELRKILSSVPEIGTLQVWPFINLYPWWDCRPDIIFHVTQNCGGEEKVIVDEDYCDTRWNINTLEDGIVLRANNEACCLSVCDDCPEGDCMIYSSVCSASITRIGGNLGASAQPEGYYKPGEAGTYVDRPFSGDVHIHGQFGSLVTGLDYYEFELFPPGGPVWVAMNPGTALGFNRQYWIGPPIFSQPVAFNNNPIMSTNFGNRNVYESLQHYEDTHGGSKPWYASNRDMLMVWRTNSYPDGLYRLRLVGWERGSDGQLINKQILPWCDTTEENYLLIRIDNRVFGASSGHPAYQNDHPIGAGTDHWQTLEPDTHIANVRIFRPSENKFYNIVACSNQEVRPSEDILFFDFIAYDKDGHLGDYTLDATHGINTIDNLLSPSKSYTLSPGSPIGVVPAAQQAALNYHEAKMQDPTIVPDWKGGVIRYEVPAHQVFPVSCCYQFKLIAYKRNIHNCHMGRGHYNISRFLFGVTLI